MKRFFEMLPGILAWLTLVLIFLFSWLLPAWVSVFIILFDMYWLLKTIFLSFHLSATFTEMKKNMKVDWIAELKELKCDPNDPNDIRMTRIAEKELSYKLTGIFFKVQNKLGRFCRERQYGDALEQELKNASIKFKREVAISIADRKSNFADFIIENKIALELKAKSFIEKEDYYQIQRYLHSANLELGLIINFSQPHLKPKRVLNPHFPNYSGHSDTFVDSNRLSYQDIYHLIILPMVHEPYEVVRESFIRLARAHYPKEKMIVVLGLEERAGRAAQETGEKIRKEFAAVFGDFLITTHPNNLPDEIPGKGSNESWAAARAKTAIIDPLIAASDPNAPNGIRMPRMADKNSENSDTFVDLNRVINPKCLSYANFLVSVFDVDTQIFPEYFSRLAYVFLTTEDPLHSIYQPIPLFTNNIYESGAFARVVSFSCSFWQMMQQSRPERLTSFSSQSIPLVTLSEIGFWHKDIVSEDSRIFWQGFFRYRGDFRTVPLFFPISMDAPTAKTFWGTMRNIYKQQRRWAWGSENVPYILEGFRTDKTISKKKRWYWTFNAIEGYHSWATNALMIFALGWLPLFFGGHHFNESLLSYNLPHLTRFIIELSMVGVASSAILSFLLLPPKPHGLRPKDYGIYFLQWILMPITLIIFGAIPAIEAQTRLMLGGKWRLGFWVTPKGRYSETGKGSGKRLVG